MKRQSDLNDVCICSRHFHGGAKTKFHNIPTIFPKKCDDGNIVWPQNAKMRRRSVVRRGLSKRSPLSVNNNNNNNETTSSTCSAVLTLTEKLECLKRKEITENNEVKFSNFVAFLRFGSTVHVKPDAQNNRRQPNRPQIDPEFILKLRYLCSELCMAIFSTVLQVQCI